MDSSSASDCLVGSSFAWGMMGVLDKILSNKSLTLANKIAPVISSSILSAYVLSGRKMSVVLGDEITDGQKQVIDARMDAIERKNWWQFGSGGG